MENYLTRIVDSILKKIESKGSVLVVGPKWCEKSTTALIRVKSLVYMQNPNNQQQLMIVKKDIQELGE